MNKSCTKCNIDKPIDDFYKRSRGGHTSQCKECVKARSRKYSVLNKQKVADNKKKYYLEVKDIEEYKEKRQKYYLDNKEAIVTKAVQYEKDKMENDILFRTKKRVADLIRKSLQSKGYKKNCRTYEILECSTEQFTDYLNDNPYGFTLDNPDMDLDHIEPLHSAETEDDVLRLNHYTNFQLLPAEYNRNIKRDKVFDKEHFENYLLTKIK